MAGQDDKNNTAPEGQDLQQNQTIVSITLTDGRIAQADLHNLSKQEASALRQALRQANAPSGTNYDELANQMAGIAKNFGSIVSLNLPAGMNYTTAMRNFMKAMKDGKGKLADGAEPYLKEIADSALGQSIMETAAYKTVAGTAAVMGAGAHFMQGLGRPYAGSAKLVGASLYGAAEVGKTTFTMSDADAQAIGTAYAAAYYMQADSPEAPQHRSTSPGVVDNVFAGAEFAAKKAWHMLPANLAAMVTSVGKFVSNGLKTGVWDIKAAYAEALQEETEFRSKPAPTFQEIRDTNVHEAFDKSTRPLAAKLLGAAGTVAGHDVTDLAQAMEKGAVTRGNDGAWHVLSFKDGKPQTELMTDADGKPMTFGHRVGGKFADAAQTFIPKNPADFFGTAIGAVPLVLAGGAVAPAAIAGVVALPGIAAAGASHAARGAAGAVTGAAKGVMAANAHPAGAFTGVNAVAKAEAEVGKLAAEKIAKEAEQVAAKAAAEQAKAAYEAAKAARHPGLGGLYERLTARGAMQKAEGNVSKVSDELTKLEGKIEGRSGLFGRHIAGAEEKATTLRGKLDAKYAFGNNNGFFKARVDASEAISSAAEKTEKAVGGLLTKGLEKVGIDVTGGLASQAPKAMGMAFTGAKWLARGTEALAPVISTYELYDGVKHKDNRKVVTSSVSLGTMGLGATAGLAIVGIPLLIASAPISIPVLLAAGGTGLAVGSIASLGTGFGAGKIYDHFNRPKVVPVAPQGAQTAEMDPGLAAANLEQQQATARAQAKQSGVGMMMANANASIGANMPGGLPARPVAARAPLVIS